MKIERKSKSTRRNKNQRKSRLEKRAKKKPNIKYRVKNETKEDIEKLTTDDYIIECETEEDSKNTAFNTLLNKIKTNRSFATKLAVAASFAIALIVVSLNISPILKYALQDENSTIYPILKKYADELRNISNKLTVVTRRLNMLSLISEENELSNTNRINSLVLQINEMWFTTKKYLNFIGIETIAHTELEKEIDANSKINEKGLIRETKAEEIFPENEITLTNVLKLDSVVQNLNIEIDNINNEITFLEDNAYAAIKASHIYSRLLERSRNANGNYYANSSVMPRDNNYATNNRQAITTSNSRKISISNDIAVQTDNRSNIRIVPVKEKIIVSKTTTEKINKKTSKKIIEKPEKLVPVALIEPVQEALKPVQVKQQIHEKPDVVIAKVRTPIKKIVGAFTIKEKSKKKSRKDRTNKITRKKKKEKLEEVQTEAEEVPFESPSLLDDVLMNYVTNYSYDDYGDPEELDDENTVSGLTPVDDDDDYTGG